MAPSMWGVRAAMLVGVTPEPAIRRAWGRACRHLAKILVVLRMAGGGAGHCQGVGSARSRRSAVTERHLVMVSCNIVAECPPTS